MKEVQFVRVDAETADYGMIKGLEYQFKGAEESIRAWVADGWEYCGYVPLVTRDINQGLKTISLVFQRDKAE